MIERARLNMLMYKTRNQIKSNIKKKWKHESRRALNAARVQFRYERQSWDSEQTTEEKICETENDFLFFVFMLILYFHT